MKLFHLAHIVFKNLMSKVVPSLLCLALALFELIIWNDLLNCYKGIIPILLILKNSWTKDGLTWSI